LSFNAALAAKRLQNGFTTATDLAETITLETGLDFRMAHRIVGRLIREATQTNRTMRDLTTADLDTASQEMLNHPLHLSETAFTQAIDPIAAVATRQGIGGAASEPVSAMLTECRAKLNTYTSWHFEAAARTTAAEEVLVRLARQLCGGVSCPSI